MRFIFLITIYFLFSSTFCFAHQPENIFLFPADSVAEINSHKQQLLLGLDIGQLVCQDLELYVMYSPNKRHSVILGVGYDFNLRDGGQKYNPDKRVYSDGQSYYTRNIERFFYGHGPAFRLVYDFNYRNNYHRTVFLSMSAIAKIRNYSDYSILLREDRTDICESGKQTILGLSFYQGVISEKKVFAIRFYWGLGVRRSYNSITCKEHFEFGGHSGNLYYPEKHFNQTTILPSLDGGIIVMIKVKGY